MKLLTVFAMGQLTPKTAAPILETVSGILKRSSETQEEKVPSSIHVSPFIFNLFRQMISQQNVLDLSASNWAVAELEKTEQYGLVIGN